MNQPLTPADIEAGGKISISLWSSKTTTIGDDGTVLKTTSFDVKVVVNNNDKYFNPCTQQTKQLTLTLL